METGHPTQFVKAGAGPGVSNVLLEYALLRI